MSYNLYNSYCSPVPFITDKKESVISWSNKSKPLSSPESFGPAVWFGLHNATAHLPQEVSPISLMRLKNYIDGIPDMLVPCASCSEHARDYIESHKQLIDSLKTGDDFFKFFVDFHNFVNERLGKPIMSLDAAKKLYKGGYAKVMKY